MRKILFLFLILASLNTLYAENDDIYEKLLTTNSEIDDQTELQNLLEYLKINKLDINKVTYENLLELPWLSFNDVEKILDFRKNKKIINKKQLIDAGLDKNTVNSILPFIFFDKREPIHFSYRIRTEHKSTTDFQSKQKLYQKYTLSWKRYKLNLIAEKDAGEKDLLDFYAGSLLINNVSIIDKIILGNYRIALGQGIIFSPKLGISKGGYAARKPTSHLSYIKPYTSTGESYSLYGIAAKIKFEKLHFVPFFSNYKLDANIGDKEIESIYTAGYHRTNTEIEKKDLLNEKLYGLHISYGYKYHFGLTATHIEFGYPFKDKNYLQKPNIYGCNININLSKINLFAEAVFSHRRKALLLGLFWKEGIFKNLIIFRTYDKYFPTYHGNPFNTGGDFDNEEGFYYGITIRPFSKTTIDLYLDIYKYPRVRYLENLPTYGIDRFLQLEKRWESTSIRFTFHQKQSEKWGNINDISKIYQFEKTTLRFDIGHNINSNIKLKFRLEYTFMDYKNVHKYNSGILSYQQIKFTLLKHLTHYIRLSQYKTNDIGLYMYENDVDGVMLNSYFSGDGIFAFILFKYDIYESLSFQVKIARKIWEEKNVNTSEQFKIQIQGKF